MARPWNFSAGPATLPEDVLRQVQEDLLDYQGSGMSVMEMSHRGREFGDILARAQADLRALLSVPEGYHVLFLQGGATQQFAQVPLNLLGPAAEERSADYIVTGAWSKKALKEASRIALARSAANLETEGEDADGFVRLPTKDELLINGQAVYLHVCTNETIHGVEVHDDAYYYEECEAPIVADMSSHILSRPVDVSRYGLIYAGAQKNIGPAGLTLVIVKDDLLCEVDPELPTVMNYRAAADNDSMLNTPPTFAIYVAGLVFAMLREKGGLEAMAEINRRKADLLYTTIDSSNLYRNPVHRNCRSRMNVPFVLTREGLDEAFLTEAKAAGLLGLKGHKSVGGMRASIYNAMPLAGVQALVSFMSDFEQRHG